MVYDTYDYSIHGLYKPIYIYIYNWGALQWTILYPTCLGLPGCPRLTMERREVLEGHPSKSRRRSHCFLQILVNGHFRNYYKFYRSYWVICKMEPYLVNGNSNIGFHKWRYPNINGHFRNLDWRYLPYIRPIFQAYVRGYTPQNMARYMVLTYLHFRILEISHWSRFL